MFRGSFTALITPFKKENPYEVDYEAFDKILNFQISNGTHGLVPCGTTGESPTLTNQEHDQVIEYCINKASGRAKILAGTGSNNTQEAIERTQHAQKAGADGALIMTPYYNKPTQEGIYRHFKEIHDNSDIDIIVYNIPGRSVIDITDETIARMSSDLPRVVGIKDSSADLSRPKKLKSLLSGKSFDMLSGEDGTAVEFNQEGGVGCISVTANIFPKECAEMQEACLEGDFKKAERINNKIAKIHDLMFCEPSPQPVKYAAELLGLCDGALRLPLIEISADNKDAIKAELQKIGALS